MNPEPRVFQFIQPDENEYENQWKESFKQLVCILYKTITLSQFCVYFCSNFKHLEHPLKCIAGNYLGIKRSQFVRWKPLKRNSHEPFK